MQDIAAVGPWAEEKLSALGRYLEYYTTVLKNQTWRTIYVDAFAGGGRAMVRPDAKREPSGPTLFLDGDEVDEGQRKLIDGSPRVALGVSNPFSRYVFVDPDPRRGIELDALREEYRGSRTISVLRSRAADGIEWVLGQRISKRTHRGVAFLDPFGAGLDWSSVQRLAETGLFEVVVNFPLGMAIQRLLPNSGEVPDPWARRLDAHFGTRDWFDQTYRKRPEGLFGRSEVEKHPDYLERLLELYSARLGRAFGNVSTPRLIRNTRGAPLYYLLWAGPHEMGLKGANYVLKMGEPVRRSRRTKG